MKTTVIVAIVLITQALPCLAAQGSTTLEEQRAKREALMQKIYRKTGGMIDRPHSEGGRFAFINMQNLVDAKALEEPVSTMVRILRHDITLEAPARPIGFSIGAMPEIIKGQNAKGAILLIEDNTLPSVLIAPESGWGVINVGYLNSDNPGALLLAQRVRREMWRVFAMVNGGANTRMGKCVLQTVLKLKDIDALDAEAFCPEPVNQILEHLDALGVKKYQRTTYETACKEGWAPAPTNDVQQAIWDKAHAIPEKPMKIEFDPKKGR